MKSFFSLLKSIFTDLKDFFSLLNPFKKKTQESPKIPSIYDNKLEELNRRLNMSLYYGYYGSKNPDDALFNLTSAIRNTYGDRSAYLSSTEEALNPPSPEEAWNGWREMSIRKKKHKKKTKKKTKKVSKKKARK